MPNDEGYEDHTQPGEQGGKLLYEQTFDAIESEIASGRISEAIGIIRALRCIMRAAHEINFATSKIGHITETLDDIETKLEGGE